MNPYVFHICAYACGSPSWSSLNDRKDTGFAGSKRGYRNSEASKETSPRFRRTRSGKMKRRR